MRLLELEIHNIRGITDLKLTPNGENFLIWGPNGSGKSAVIDSIDFLLTGQISRLVGKGTGDISLNKHGPHIDHKPEESIVRAVIKLNELEEPIELKRCIAKPNEIICDEDSIEYLKPIMFLASQGQHVLTRREILKYVTAEANTRAQEIQELLNISEIEDIRKSFVKAKNNLKNDLQSIKRIITESKTSVNTTIEETEYNEKKILSSVNKSRKTLGGKEIKILNSKNLKKDITRSTEGKRSEVNIKIFERILQKVKNVFTEDKLSKINKTSNKIWSVINKKKKDSGLLSAYKKRKLVKMGLELIDESENCPLCEKDWPKGELKEFLENKLLNAKKAKEYKDKISELSEDINNKIISYNTNIKEILKVVEELKLKDEKTKLENWLNDLQKLLSALNNPIEDLKEELYSTEKILKIVAPDYEKVLENIFIKAKEKYTDVTDIQTEWDILTRLEENLKAVENAENKLNSAKLLYQRADILLDEFQKSRDFILGNLYEEIKDKFEKLYKDLHGEDEDNFSAIFKPDGAGIDFKVDFYGRGNHPPHALHSEGHQDSMGLCLYLALNEKLIENLIDLIILDDVVMSVDIQHRRSLCRLLTTAFPSKQFLITTHDKTWANQLRGEGVIKPKGTIEFFNWNIETGTNINYEVEIWERINKDIIKNDIASASAKLRRGLEEFFTMVCDFLQVPVKFKLSGRWELGDLLFPAMDKYKEIINKSIKAAISWNNKDIEEKLKEIDSVRSAIRERTMADQWAINASLHYNNWENMGKEDFKPVVDAFQDLCNLYICSSSKCGSFIRLSIVDNKPENVKCNCGKINWNLKMNTKTGTSNG